jgi:hypothetical protein
MAPRIDIDKYLSTFDHIIDDIISSETEFEQDQDIASIFGLEWSNDLSIFMDIAKHKHGGNINALQIDQINHLENKLISIKPLLTKFGFAEFDKSLGNRLPADEYRRIASR